MQCWYVGIATKNVRYKRILHRIKRTLGNTCRIFIKTINTNRCKIFVYCDSKYISWLSKETTSFRATTFPNLCMYDLITYTCSSAFIKSCIEIM